MRRLGTPLLNRVLHRLDCELILNVLSPVEVDSRLIRMRPGHIGHGAPHVPGCILAIPVIREPAIPDVALLFDHGNHLGIQAVDRKLIADAAVARYPGLEQEPVRHRDGVIRDDQLLGVLLTLERRLGLPRRADIDGALAVGLLPEGEAELLPPRRLISQTPLAALGGRLVEAGLAEVGDVGPEARVVGVPVYKGIGRVVGGGIYPRRGEEPQPVLHDGAAHAGIEIVTPLDRVGRAQSPALQVLREVAALECVAAVAGKQHSVQLVAPLAVHDIDPDAPGRILGAGAARIDDQLLLRHDIELLTRDRSRGSGCGHRSAVSQEDLIAGTPAMEPQPDGHADRAPADVLALNPRGARRRHTRNQCAECRRRTPRGDDVEHLPVQHALLRRALHIDNRRLACHCDRFGDLADAKLGVNRRDERAGDFDALALHCGEAGQQEGDGIGAGRQELDPILTGTVGDHRPRLSIRAGLVASTVTPGNAAPDVSLTAPAMVPCACAAAGTRTSHARAIAACRKRVSIGLPLSELANCLPYWPASIATSSFLDNRNRRRKGGVTRSPTASIATRPSPCRFHRRAINLGPSEIHCRDTARVRDVVERIPVQHVGLGGCDGHARQREGGLVLHLPLQTVTEQKKKQRGANPMQDTWGPRNENVRISAEP